MRAGARSQGYGTHEVSTIDNYTLPGADFPCAAFNGNPASGGQFSLTGAACVLGIMNFVDPTTNSGFYTTVGSGPNQNQFICEGNNQALGGGPPNNCPGKNLDLTSLLGFLTMGPRYSPSLGALLHLSGSALYKAEDDVQGSAGNAGRGLFLDAQGGSALLADDRAQAYADAGTTATLVGGASVLRLGRDGQATVCSRADCQPAQRSRTVPQAAGPEANLTGPATQALLLTVGTRDAACQPGTCRQGGVDQALDSPLLDPRVVTLSLPAGPVTGLGAVDVKVDVTPAADDPLQVLVFSIPYAGWEPDSGGVRCTGAPMAAPTRLVDDLVDGSGSFTVPLDLEAMSGPGHALVPAGCTQVHAFARPIAADTGGGPISVTEWGQGSGTILLLPPARGIQLEAAGFSTSGSDQPIPFQVRVAEPLLPFLPPDLQFRAVHGTAVVADASRFFMESGWTAGLRSVALLPPAGIPEGEHALEARTRWTEEVGWSDWADLGQSILVDQNPPDLQVELASIAPVVRYKQDITVAGVASDISGVGAVLLRLLNDTGSLVPLHEPCAAAAAIPNLSGAQATCALLDVPGGGEVAWLASFRPHNALAAGSLLIQVAAADGGGAARDWENVGTVRLDGSSPAVTSVVTDAGLAAAGPSPETGNATVRLLLHVCDRAEADEDACIPGGVDVEHVAMSAAHLVNGNLERIPLARDATSDEDLEDGGVLLGYTWSSASGDAIPEDRYELFILARDVAGNLFDHNPGRPFAVDRTAPTLQAPDVALPMMTNPLGERVTQAAVKVGDAIHVSVSGSDSNPDLLAARLLAPGEEDPVDDVTQLWTNLLGQTLVLSVPEGADNGSGAIELVVAATDLAMNQAVRNVSVPFVSPFAFVGAPQVTPRADSALVSWNLSRPLDGPGDGMRAILQDPSGTPLGESHPEPLEQAGSYGVRFSKLAPGQDYKVLLQVWDGANHTLQRALDLRTFDSSVGTALVAATPTGSTYSGILPIEGQLFPGSARIAGAVTLHPGGATAPAEFRVAGMPNATKTLALEGDRGTRQAFTLIWDSRETVPPGTGARLVELEVRFDDGSTVWNDTVALRIDNTAPAITPTITGPAANNGWHNGTVVVRASASDDTQLLPAAPAGSAHNLVHRTAVQPGPEHASDSATLSNDGTYTVRFTVLDGAVPPNEANLSAVVRVDRTLPTLRVASGLPSVWTNRSAVPLTAEASDGGSGLDGYRVRVSDGNWSAWNATAPRDASLADLPEGEHWVDVEVRDRARNVRRETLSTILDKTAPALVDARWVGTSDDGWPVLQAISRDPTANSSRPSGVDAIRFAPAALGPWTAWSQAGTSAVFPITNGTNGTWLQLRDRAGNVGPPRFVNASLHETITQDPDNSTSEVGALSGGHVAPREGSPETRFTFSVRVRPMDGDFPSDVLLQVAGGVHPMAPEGPVLEDGGRIYTATVALPPTRLDRPHSFRVAAVYEEATVATAELPGPTVFALGPQNPELDESGGSKGAPGVGPALFALLLLAMAKAGNRRRRQ